MLSMILLSFAMLSAAWAYARMFKSGELSADNFPLKYKVILILYVALALFVLYAAGIIFFAIYMGIALLGFGIGWSVTKEGSYVSDSVSETEDDGTIKLRMPLSATMSVINHSIDDYTYANNEEKILHEDENTGETISESNTSTSNESDDSNNDNDDSQETSSADDESHNEKSDAVESNDSSDANDNASHDESSVSNQIDSESSDNSDDSEISNENHDEQQTDTVISMNENNDSNDNVIIDNIESKNTVESDNTESDNASIYDDIMSKATSDDVNSGKKEEDK